LKKIGIVGLPNAGKSSLFNFLTRGNALVESFPFSTVDPNFGVFVIEDERVEVLARNEKSKRVVHPSIDVVDIAGLVRGASKGEGLGNQFLDHIRKVDAIAHVVRFFESATVSHPYQTVDPKRDVEIIDTELILKDIETIQKRLEKQQKIARAGDKDARKEVELLEALLRFLSEGGLARNFPRRDSFEEEVIKSLFLLTDKPEIMIFNVDDLTEGKESVAREIAQKRKSEYVVLNVALETELLELSEEEADAFRAEYGFSGDKRKEFFEKIVEALKIIRFLTATENEARCWLTVEGTTAYEAAGMIHSDIQKGFVKAEVIPFDEYVRHGSLKRAREMGALQTHGKEYVIREGDVIHFLFRA